MVNKSNRRNVLKLCAAAVLGAMASVAGMQVIPKAKAEGETVVVGGEYTTATSRTLIQGDVGDNGVIEGRHTGTSGAGVYGESGDDIGVSGNSNGGNGVYGYSQTSNGVKAESDIGTALYVKGTNYFESAQRGTISSSVRTYDVTVSSGVTIGTNAMIFVTLMNNPNNIGVKYVERLSTTTFRIHLTGMSRNSMDFGYIVVN